MNLISSQANMQIQNVNFKSGGGEHLPSPSGQLLGAAHTPRVLCSDPMALQPSCGSPVPPVPSRSWAWTQCPPQHGSHRTGGSVGPPRRLSYSGLLDLHWAVCAEGESPGPEQPEDQREEHTLSRAQTVFPFSVPISHCPRAPGPASQTTQTAAWPRTDIPLHCGLAALGRSGGAGQRWHWRGNGVLCPGLCSGAGSEDTLAWHLCRRGYRCPCPGMSRI